MNRITAFSPAILAALLAACAPDSLTSSDSSDAQAHLDSISRSDSQVANADSAARDSSGAIPSTDPVVAGVPSVPETPAVTETPAVPEAPAVPATGDVADASDPKDVTPPQDASDPKDVTPPQDASDPKDVKEPEAPVVVAKPDAPAAVPDPGSSGTAKALEGTWKRVAHSITPAISVDGVPVSDLLTQDEASSRDNLTVLKAGGVWTEDEGATKSLSQDVQSEDGAWSVNADGSTLSFYPSGAPRDGEHFEFKVLEVSPTTLKVSTASGAYSDNLAHSETITFTRQ